MICRETRASDWLCQLSRARPMTAASFIRVYPRTTDRMELQTPGAASGTVQFDGARLTLEKFLIHVICSDPLPVESYFVQ